MGIAIERLGRNAVFADSRWFGSAAVVDSGTSVQRGDVSSGRADHSVFVADVDGRRGDARYAV